MHPARIRVIFMKKLLIPIIALLFFFSGESVLAQDSPEHLEFKGIPITGSLDSFIDKLEAQGYKQSERIDNAVVMEGSFTGKDVTLFIFGSKKTKNVWKVQVRFEKSTTWSSLKSDYNYYKSAFEKKYGKPDASYEFFSRPYYEGDGFELQAVRVEKCTFFTSFKATGGVIYISMDKSERLVINYEDSDGTEIQRKEKEASVIDDI